MALTSCILTLGHLHPVTLTLNNIDFIGVYGGHLSKSWASCLFHGVWLLTKHIPPVRHCCILGCSLHSKIMVPKQSKRLMLVKNISFRVTIDQWFCFEWLKRSDNEKNYCLGTYKKKVEGVEVQQSNRQCRTCYWIDYHCISTQYLYKQDFSLGCFALDCRTKNCFSRTVFPWSCLHVLNVIIIHTLSRISSSSKV